MPPNVKVPLTLVATVAALATPRATAPLAAVWESITWTGTSYAGVPGVRPCRSTLPFSTAPSAGGVPVGAIVGVAGRGGVGVGVVVTVAEGVLRSAGVNVGVLESITVAVRVEVTVTVGVRVRVGERFATKAVAV